MLLHLIDAEPDVILHIFTYLPLRSLLRLRSTSQALNLFIQRREKAIRSSLQVRLRLKFRSNKVKLNIDIEENHTIRLIVSHDPEDVVDMELEEWRLFDDVTAYKNEDRLWIIPVREDDELLAVTQDIMSTICRDFSLDELDLCKDPRPFTLPNEPQPVDNFSKPFISWLINHARQVYKLIVLLNDDLMESELIEIINMLGVKFLAIRKKSDRSDFNGTWDLSQDLFQTVKLQCFKANFLHCELRDADIERYDLLEVNRGQTLITSEGIYAWARHKLQTGRFGDRLVLRRSLEEGSVLVSRLREEFQHESTDPTRNLFISSTGIRLILQSGNNHPNNSIRLTVAESFKSTPRSFLMRQRDFDIAIEIQVKTAEADAKVQLKTAAKAKLNMFRFTKEKPINGVLIAAWTKSIFLYNISFHEFVIHIADGEIDEAKMIEALELLGRKLRQFPFTRARCESGRPNSSLWLLEKLHSGYGRQLDRLSICSATAPSEKVLLPILNILRVERFSFTTFDGSSLTEPWHLSETFFKETPQLKAFTIRPFTWRLIPPCEHFIGVNDETLQRFDKLKMPPDSKTSVTRKGVTQWVERQLKKKDPEMRIGLNNLMFQNERGKVYAEILYEEEGKVSEDSSEERLCIRYAERYVKRKIIDCHPLEHEPKLHYMPQERGESTDWDSDEGRVCHQFGWREH